MNWPLCSYSTRGVAHKGHRYCKAHIRMRVPPLIPGWLSGSIIIWLWWYQHRNNAWWRYSCFAGYYVLSFAYLPIVMEQGKTRAMTTALYMDLVLKSWFQCDPPSCSFFLRISLIKPLWNWEMKQMPTSVEESNNTRTKSEFLAELSIRNSRSQWVTGSRPALLDCWSSIHRLHWLAGGVECSSRIQALKSKAEQTNHCFPQ